MNQTSADIVDDWQKTGECPQCGKRYISGGRCLMCGWISEFAINRLHGLALTENEKFDADRVVHRIIQEEG